MHAREIRFPAADVTNLYMRGLAERNTGVAYQTSIGIGRARTYVASTCSGGCVKTLLATVVTLNPFGRCHKDKK